MNDRVLRAPAFLGVETRGLFKQQALELIAALGTEAEGRLVVDLSATKHVDSAGLGALVIIQRRAAEARRSVCLRGASEEVRFLLMMTRLDDRFVIEPPAG